MIGNSAVLARCTLSAACARPPLAPQRLFRLYSSETGGSQADGSPGAGAGAGAGADSQTTAPNPGSSNEPANEHKPAAAATEGDAATNTTTTKSAASDGIREVRTVDGPPNLYVFRLETFDPELPLVMREGHRLPVMERWFERRRHGHVFTPRLSSHNQTVFPYELTDPGARGPEAAPPLSEALPLPYVLTEFRNWLINRSNERYLPLMALIAGLMDPSMAPQRAGGGEQGQEEKKDDGRLEFRQFYGPLGLLGRACEFNETRRSPAERLQRLYIAQAPVHSLPAPLGAFGVVGPGQAPGEGDLPTPGLVRGAGRGDVYGSSVWLGLEPTYTPPHRDPNPNLFCQLLGEKRVRLLPPARGDALYARVLRDLGLQTANSRFRGPEMMGGAEREALERAVWSAGEAEAECKGDPELAEDMQQTVLRPGDSMFIPKGWWHSIRSNGAGVLNASVNWWFR